MDWYLGIQHTFLPIACVANTLFYPEEWKEPVSGKK